MLMKSNVVGVTNDVIIYSHLGKVKGGKQATINSIHYFFMHILNGVGLYNGNII